MEITIIKEKENPLLSRKRVTLETVSEGTTPSRLSLKSTVAKKLKIAENVVAIRHIYPKFGNKSVKIIAHVYDNEASMNKIEDKNIIRKNSPKKEEQPAQ